MSASCYSGGLEASRCPPRNRSGLNPCRRPPDGPATTLLDQSLSVKGGKAMGEFVLELWAFMKERKKFWLLPILVVLLLFGSLIVLTQGSAVAPFIYTLF
jgi:hypothetical protein